MSERYEIICQESVKASAADAPVSVQSYLLLHDSIGENDAVLLKLNSVSSKRITDVGVTVTMLNAKGDTIGELEKFWYTSLNVTPGTEFGAKTKLPLPISGVKGCAAVVSAVRYADGSYWYADPAAVEEIKRKKASPADPETGKQSASAQAAPKAEKSTDTAETVHLPKPAPEEQAIRQQEKAAAALLRKQKIAAFLRKTKWYFIGGFGAAAAAALTIFLIVPLIRYSVANNDLEHGEYTKAAEIYASLNDFSKSKERLGLSVACQNIQNGNLEAGISSLLSQRAEVSVGYDVGAGSFGQDNWKDQNTYSSPESFNGVPTAQKEYYSFDGWNVTRISCALEKDRAYADLQFAAEYQPIPYTITYTNLQDGTTSNPTQYNVESDTIQLSAPTRTGYTFLYWSQGSNPAEVKNANIPSGSNGDVSFKANWKANHYVVKVLPKGELPAEGETLDKTAFSLEYDAEYSLPKLEKRGYDFIGWTDGTETYSEGIWKTARDIDLEPSFQLSTYAISYDIADGELSKRNPDSYTMLDDDIAINNPTRFGYQFVGWTWEDQEEAVNPAILASGSVGDKHFVANWKGNPHTVSLDANGGSVSGNSVGVTFGSKYSLPVPYKTGYDFNGWYSGSTKYSGGVWNLDENVSVKASWSAKKFNIQLNAAGGSGAASSISVTYDSSYSLPTPRRTGYTFLGWYNNGAQYNGGIWTTDAAVTLTAQWEGNHYTVNLNANGGSLSASSVGVTYGSSYSLPKPTRTGYDFVGWSTSSYSYSGTFPASGTWNTDSNVTLYAKWEVKRCTIYLDANGGSISYGGSTEKVNYGSYYSLPTPRREGYDFDGWYDGGTKFASSGTYEIDGDVSLKAHWTGKSCTVYLDANGGSGVPSTETYTYGSYYSLPTPYRDGYTFDGWYTSRYSGSRFSSSGTWNSTYSEYLYAHWTAAPTLPEEPMN